MAKRKIKKISKKRNLKKEIKQEIFSKIKLTESYTSLILGAIVVLIVGIFIISFAKINKNTQTSSSKDIQTNEDQNLQDSNTSSTYTVKPGDDLWTISENVYHDGYRWIEIARINNLENPGLIYAGNRLIVPTVAPTTAQEKPVAEETAQAVQAQNSIAQNNSITGNTYTVMKGDSLWGIAVRAYGDGFKWPEIAKANKLLNPDTIHAGNKFTIPR